MRSLLLDSFSRTESISSFARSELEERGWWKVGCETGKRCFDLFSWRCWISLISIHGEFKNISLHGSVTCPNINWRRSSGRIKRVYIVPLEIRETKSVKSIDSSTSFTIHGYITVFIYFATNSSFKGVVAPVSSIRIGERETQWRKERSNLNGR